MNEVTQLEGSFDPLSANDFAVFFEAVHGYPPYQWQIDLTHRIDREGWPDQLSLPTGSGKTSVLDIAIFSLALQAERSLTYRTTATRIFFVVDRRIVVDAAATLAAELAMQVNEDSPHDVVRNVANRLKTIGGSDGRARLIGDDAAIATHVLRGGFYRTNEWARSATQPTIVTATVDQIGSRLLFRGYGISPAARSLQAALVGSDSLILIDEAHIARPFAETARSVADYQRRDEARLGRRLTQPVQIVELSATMVPSLIGSQAVLDGIDPPAPPRRDIFTLDLEAEITRSPQSPLIRRYQAEKPIRLAIADKAKGKRWSTALAKDLAARVEANLTPGVDSLAVVVNRVKTAVELCRLVKALKSERDIDVELMIGRMRPHDRDQIAATLQDRLATSRGGRAGERPIVVVATQCLEVGADLDFQRMICEAASFDALRQRFGRLNRSGDQPNCGGEVVIRGDQFVDVGKLDTIAGSKSNANDPVYADSLSRTFAWLQSLAVDDAIDFGSRAMDAVWKSHCQEAESQNDPDRITRLLAGDAERAVLMPAHLKMLVQTGSDPCVHPDPDVDVFLHGRTEPRFEVAVCWRSDLFDVAEIPAGNKSDRAKQHYWLRPLSSDAMVSAVTELPPTSAECMTVPIGQLRRFLSGERGMDDALSDSVGDGVDGEDDWVPDQLRGVLYRGPDHSVACRRLSELRPGDTLVLPVSAGGWSQMGHIPDDDDDLINAGEIDGKVDVENVAQVILRRLLRIDVADEASLAARWKLRLRLMPSLMALGCDLSGVIKELSESEVQVVDDEWLRDRLTKRSAGDSGVLSSMTEQLLSLINGPMQIEGKGKLRLSLRPSGAGLILAVHDRLSAGDVCKLLQINGETGASTPELDFVESNASDRAVPLDLHCQSVGVRADEMAAATGLPEPERIAVARAGGLHDLGKADPRFQALLSGMPSRIAWLARRPLAKSGRIATSAAMRRRDRERSGLPSSFRHERTTISLCEQFDLEHDPLTLYLIATHHGYARPWYPPCHDPAPPEISSRAIAFAFNKDLISDTLPPASGTGKVVEEPSFPIRIAERFWQVQQVYGPWNAAWLETLVRLSDQQVSREEAEASIDEETPRAVAGNALSRPGSPRPVSGRGVGGEGPILISVPLPGLDGGNTLAFLAALGTFALLDQDAQTNHHARPKIQWSEINGAIRPTMWIDPDLNNPDAIVDRLSSLLESEFTGPRRWLDDGYLAHQTRWPKGSGKINPNPHWVRHVAETTRRRYCQIHDLTSQDCDWVTALASEASQKRSNKNREVDYSHLYLTRGSGHQRMFEIARGVRQQTEPHHLREALFETWRYDDLGRGLALRLDAAEDRPYAMRWLDPSGDPIRTVRGANTLAFEGMVLFPTAVVNRTLVTTGFHRLPRQGTVWFWPLWRHPIGFDVVISLMQLGLLGPQRISDDDEPNQDQSRAIESFLDDIGIEVVYRSQRKINDKFFNFSPATAIN